MTAVVVLADGFEEIEAVTPIDLLRRAGISVVVAGLTATTATGARGIRVVCDALLEQVSPDWDALILPGGLPGARNLAESSLIAKILKDAQARGAWVAALCAAPTVVLGSLGYLAGRRFTGYPGMGDGPDTGYVAEPVVVDGNLVTSPGVATAGAFSLRLIELLLGPEKSAEVGRAVLLR